MATPPPISETLAQARLAQTAAGDPPPGWVAPALVLGLAMPPLTAAARRDVDAFRRLPPMPGDRAAAIRSLPGLPAATLTGVALGAALLFGFVRVGISDVYTESWLFLALVLVLGLASPAAGLLLTIAFVPADLFAVITRGTLDPTLPALGGRVISWWLLGLLAVTIPLVARQVPAAVLASGHPASPGARRLLAFAGGAAVAAGLALLWCAATVELIRPVFTWTSMLGNPRPAVIGPITDGRDGLLIVAAVAALAWTAMRDLLRITDDEARADADPPAAVPRPPALVVRYRPIRWLAAAAIGVLLLGALVTSPLDLVVLGGVLLVGRPGVRRLWRRMPVGMLLLGQLPWITRLAVGVALAWVAATVVTFLLTGPAFGSERFPIMVATAFALLILALALELDTATDDLLRERDERAAERAAAERAAAGPAGPGGIGAAIVAGAATLGSFAVLLLVPAAALAQGSAPCPVGEVCLPPAATGAAAAVGAAVLVTLTLGTGGRFVSIRRDRATRQPVAGAAAVDPADAGFVDRCRAAVLAAWRAG